MNPIAMWKGMDRSDRAMFAGILASLIVWYIYKGKQYNPKGLK